MKTLTVTRQISTLIAAFLLFGLLIPEPVEAKRFGGGGFKAFRSFKSPKRYGGGFFSSRKKSAPSGRYAASGTQKPAGSGFDQAKSARSTRTSSKKALDQYRTQSGKFTGRSATAAQAPGQKQKLYYKERLNYEKNRPGRTHAYNSGTYYDRRSNQYGGFNPPAYAFGGSPFYGGFDSMFLWYMLLNSSHNSFYYHNRSDPAIQEWRSEAERLAQDNTELKARLDALDAKTAEMSAAGIVEEPGKLPEGIDPDLVYSRDYAMQNKEVFYADEQIQAGSARIQEGGGFMSSLIMSFLILSGLYFFVFVRRS